MLFSVEGGFFTSSVSGYSKGLTLLFLGHKEEDRPMKVLPWNQYQLVRQESSEIDDLQLASGKNRVARACANCACFGGCASTAPEAPSTQKVSPSRCQDDFKEPSSASKAGDAIIENVLKSSLRMASNRNPVSKEECDGKVRDVSSTTCTAQRTVQWNDACGKELTVVREFEPSEIDMSDDELDNSSERSCSCAMM